ncbi:Teichoic acids export ATP-binding protein TagH [compost metagenome]
MSNKKQVAVAVNHIHKEFILPQHKNTTFKQTVVNIVKKNNKVTQKVLDGVSFEVNKGDFFGIVGRNGSGKSTLLKLIAGVYSPTAGEVKLSGGLTPFIELGVGFNPELSGRDNVFLNGALLGYDRKQMAEMYDEIVDFAELGPFMEQKLKNYSSGMQVRLAFSIAIKAKNDILIFDEVLAVGDEAFQRKCLDVFEQYKAEGQTVILVTHDMETVRQYCNRAVLISDGKVLEVGDPRKIANRYSVLNQVEIDTQVSKDKEKIVSNIHVDLFNSITKKEQVSFASGDSMTISVSWGDIQPVESVGVNIFKESGEHVTGHNSRYDKNVDAGVMQKCQIDYSLNLKPGKYHVVVEVFGSKDKVIDALLRGPAFTILGSDEPLQWSGLIDLPHKWYK